MNKAVMIDIETLDTRESAVVLSIGAVAFDLESDFINAAMFHEHLTLTSQIAVGRTISPDTVEWWLRQDDDARKGVVNVNRIGVSNSLAQLSAFIAKSGATSVWGNGAMFDNAIVKSLARSFDLGDPWSYKLDRCYRTLKAIAFVDEPAFEGVEHNALDDAIHQARHLQKIWKVLEL